MENRETWKSRSTFILAAIGSAVGLGNAWRFPGLAAKHGGGAFLLAYVLVMLAVGVPLLMMEIAIGRKTRQGAASSLRAINRKAEPVGWMSVANGFFIQIYYAVVFGWVILMFLSSYKFGTLTGTENALADAKNIWATAIQTTGTTSGIGTISTFALVCMLIAWVACFLCIKNGTTSVGKVVKYTVSLPVICLLILAVKGFTMQNAGDGIRKLFVPEWKSLLTSDLWVDAIGQVFYSLSVAMAIMFAYGSFLKDDANIAVDALIIAFSDLVISVLAGVVMFTTMAGVGMLGDITASGIGTAFMVYPQAIVQLTNIPWVNALFGYVFYFCLITLAIDSLFSIVEGVSTAVSDKFGLVKKKTTLIICIISLLLGLLFVTSAGLGWLDIVDNFINNYSLLLTGVVEAIVVGWFFKTSLITDEINRNTKKFKMPGWWIENSIKYVAPILLSALFVWNLVTLFTGSNKGLYGRADGYSLTANILGGWLIVALTIASGFIVKLFVKMRAKKGFVEKEIYWDVK